MPSYYLIQCQLPRTVCRAKGPTVILKIVKSDEYKIHSSLAAIDSPDNHTIPIFDEFPRGVERLIATRQEQVLREAPPQLLQTTGHPLARQFLEGVSFMHKHHVAHLDLKPDNIVITATGRLLIIDYGISVQVSGQESWIKGGIEGRKGGQLQRSGRTQIEGTSQYVQTSGRRDGCWYTLPSTRIHIPAV